LLSPFAGAENQPFPTVGLWTADPIVPDRFDPLLSRIVVEPDDSFISQSATVVVAPKAESTPADAVAIRSTMASRYPRLRAEQDPRKKRTCELRQEYYSKLGNVTEAQASRSRAIELFWLWNGACCRDPKHEIGQRSNSTMSRLRRYAEPWTFIQLTAL
jgi:hypothetical protein